MNGPLNVSLPFPYFLIASMPSATASALRRLSSIAFSAARMSEVTTVRWSTVPSAHCFRRFRALKLRPPLT